MIEVETIVYDMRQASHVKQYSEKLADMLNSGWQARELSLGNGLVKVTYLLKSAASPTDMAWTPRQDLLDE